MRGEAPGVGANARRPGRSAIYLAAARIANRRSAPGRFLLAALAALVAGCASYSGSGLRPGIDSERDVRRTMGEPAEVYEGAGGARALAYPRGPLGTETFMVRLAPDGRLAGIEQVLDEAHFARIVVGRSTPEEVLRLIGPPGETGYLSGKRQTVWTYRFRDAWHYLADFSVLFGPGGRVDETVTVRVDGPFERR